MPMKIGLSLVPVAVIRIVPSLPLLKSQSGPSEPTSSLSETRACVEVVNGFDPVA
jgi:hypothetical protein